MEYSNIVVGGLQSGTGFDCINRFVLNCKLSEKVFLLSFHDTQRSETWSLPVWLKKTRIECIIF